MIMMLSWLNKNYNIYKDRQHFIKQIRIPTEAVSETLSPKNNINDCWLLPSPTNLQHYCPSSSKLEPTLGPPRFPLSFPYGLERRTLSGVNMPCTQPSDESKNRFRNCGMWSWWWYETFVGMKNWSHWKNCNKKNRTVLIETPIHSLSICQFQAKSVNTTLLYTSHMLFMLCLFMFVSCRPLPSNLKLMQDISLVKISEVLNKDSQTASPGHEMPIFHQPNLPCAWPCAKPDKICRSSSAISAPVPMKNVFRSAETWFPSNREQVSRGLDRDIFRLAMMSWHPLMPLELEDPDFSQRGVVAETPIMPISYPSKRISKGLSLGEPATRK